MQSRCRRFCGEILSLALAEREAYSQTGLAVRFGAQRLYGEEGRELPDFKLVRLLPPHFVQTSVLSLLPNAHSLQQATHRGGLGIRVGRSAAGPHIYIECADLRQRTQFRRLHCSRGCIRVDCLAVALKMIGYSKRPARDYPDCGATAGCAKAPLVLTGMSEMV